MTKALGKISYHILTSYRTKYSGIINNFVKLTGNYVLPELRTKSYQQQKCECDQSVKENMKTGSYVHTLGLGENTTFITTLLFSLRYKRINYMK